jgi:zinc protease
VQFDDQLVNPERGVVQAEKRVRDQQHEDIDKLRKMIYSQPEYAREVIGTDGTLARATAQGLREYYRRNYTAERMTIIIAGQLTKDVTYWEEQIRKRFADVPRGSGEPARPAFEVTPRVRSMALEYGSNYVVGVSSLQRSAVSTTADDIRRDLIDTVSNAILSRRLNRAANREAGFASASVSDAGTARDARMFDLSLSLTGPEQMAPGMDLLKQEFGVLRSQPPNSEELDLARQEILQRARNGVAEEDKAQPAGVAGTLMNVAAQGGYYLSASQWLVVVQTLLPAIRASEISASLGRRISSRDWLLVAMSPKGSGRVEAAVPVLKEKLAGFGDKPADVQRAGQRPLAELKIMTALPEPGRVQAEKSLPYGVSEWMLSNGLTVVLKPMAEQSNDRILMQLIKRDGAYALTPEETPAARLAAAGAWTVSGLGELDDDESVRFFSGKTVRMNPFAGESQTGVSGSANNADLETLFQAVHSFIRAPRYQQLKSTSATSLRSQQAQPEFLAGQAWRQARIGAWPQLDALDPASLAGVSIEQLTALHQRSYGNAAEYTLALTGNLDLPRVRALVERYFASLPGNPAVSKVVWRVNPTEKTGVSVVRSDNPAPRTRVVVRYAQPDITTSAQNNVLAFMVGQVLAERVRNALREQAGLAYSPSVRMWIWEPPFKGSVLNVEATVDPAQAQRARDIMTQAVAELLQRPATMQEMEAVRAAHAQEMREIDRNPAQVLSVLARSRVGGESLEQWLAARDSAGAIDSAALQLFVHASLRNVAPSVLNFGPAK